MKCSSCLRDEARRRERRGGISAPRRFVIRSFPLSYPLPYPVINSEGERKGMRECAGLASPRFASSHNVEQRARGRTRRRRRRMAASSRSRCRTFAIIVVEPDVNPCGKRVAHFARVSV